jgi:hypothetical protein
MNPLANEAGQGLVTGDDSQRSERLDHIQCGAPVAPLLGTGFAEMDAGPRGLGCQTAWVSFKAMGGYFFRRNQHRTILATGAAAGAVGAGMLDLDRARGTLANAIAPVTGTATQVAELHLKGNRNVRRGVSATVPQNAFAPVTP